MSLHPGPVDAGLTPDVGNSILTAVMDRVRPPDDVVAAHVLAEINLRIGVQLTDVRRVRALVPQRQRTVHHWPAGGYAPEAIFDRLARRRVRTKLRRGQASSDGLAAAVLVIDLSEVPATDAWGIDYYRDAFIASTERHVAPRLQGHDAVVFIAHRHVHCTVADDAAPPELVSLLRNLW